MGRKFLLFMAVALVGMVVVPAFASANLVNEYGMHYAGQAKCLTCHTGAIGPLAGVSDKLHGAFATSGLSPAAPASWTKFVAAGGVGSSYDIVGNDWITLGAAAKNSGTEYLVWKGSSDPTVMPWNLVEGLVWAPEEGWVVGDDPAAGLSDAAYGCQRCHMLGSTMNGTGKTVANPAAVNQPTATTAVQWARDESKSATDFRTTASVSTPGLGIQCENCHGTGASSASGHMGTGVDITGDFEALGNSQLCGQCHGSYTNAGTSVGVYGYTPNLPIKDFVNINGASGGQSYTYIPTATEFLATPTAYWMFPNGSNAKGNHFYYNEWASSAHSYRPALAKDDPTASAFQNKGTSHYAVAATAQQRFDLGCYKCHTGEGYLTSKEPKPGFAKDFTPTADNVGKMGQECQTCHNGHPSSVGGDDTVRQPDQAGVRSNKGLTTANTSICEDCHNWQMEVQDLTPQPAPQATLEAHGGASHPQRETLHGRSIMMDVPDAGQFMPGTKCTDCHMVKTNKDATRISHGMKPMLPGDAKTWDTAAGTAYKGQDSCTKCHGGQTRDELQADIDTWQGNTAAQAAKVAAAITAATAKAGPAKVANAKSAEFALIGRATWNYKAYENDSSVGVHNPTYIMAGLVKAEQLAKSVGGKFAHSGATPKVRKGRTAHIAGTVLNGDGSGAAGAQLTLVRGASGTKVLATTVADSHGNFAFTLKPAKTAKTYRVRWARSSVAATDLMSTFMKIVVR